MSSSRSLTPLTQFPKLFSKFKNSTPVIYESFLINAENIFLSIIYLSSSVSILPPGHSSSIRNFGHAPFLGQIFFPSHFRQQSSLLFTSQSKHYIPHRLFLIPYLQVSLLFLMSCWSPHFFASFCVPYYLINKYLLHSYYMMGPSSVLEIEQ